MDTLRAMLNAYLTNSLTTDDFADHFIEYWNGIRIEQNQAIEEFGVRETLDELWQQYRSGEIDEITYGMQWTGALSKLKNVRILPQSFVFTIGNKIYNLLTLLKESDHLDTQEIPTDEAFREEAQRLLDLIDI